MMKNEAASAFFRLARGLDEAGLSAHMARAAVRGDAQTYFYAEFRGGATAYEAAASEKPMDAKNDPFVAALAVKPDAVAVLLLGGDYAVTAADALSRLPAELDDMAQIVGLTARVMRSFSSGEVKKRLRARNSCFVRGEGMFITGRSVTEAVTGAILLEKAAMTHILAQKIGGAKRVPLLSAALMHAVYQKKYSKINLAEEAAKANAPSGGSPTCAAPECAPHETALREEIVAYGKRLSAEGYVQGTWGNIAVRLDETHMLVTPSGLDYRILMPEDIVKVELTTLAYEGKRKPTSEKRLHRDLFLARMDVGAAIHTHARYCGVFAAARQRVPCGEGILCAPHALPSTKQLSKVALKALGKRSACLLMNHGVLCCGADLASAYDACVESERAAKECLSL